MDTSTRRPAAMRRTTSTGPPPPGSARPATQPDASRRKQTLLSLLDVLHEMQEDDLGGPGAAPRSTGAAYDEAGDAPNMDVRMQAEGAAAFEQFQGRVKDLDRELQTFANAVTQLGSSVGLLSSSFQLRLRLARILRLVRDNAAELFPSTVTKATQYNTAAIVRDFALAKLRYGPRERNPLSALNDNLDAEDFPHELESLAGDLENFLKRLNEFPEFSDEFVNASITAFEGDLKYWASCLSDFKGQLKYPSVTRYVHDLSREIGDHLKHITNALVVFIKVGVPTIRFGQEHGSTHLLNMSTIATFFSAVTATTIQYTFEDTSPMGAMVNAFWFSSLIFSIASAVNSLLGLTWKQAMYRSPGHRVPWWVSIWIKRSPLIFLVVSVAAFSIGFVLFTFSTQQPIPVRIVATVFTACSSFGLMAVSSWFIFERWTFSRHKGQKWLDDVVTETNKRIRHALGVEWVAAKIKRLVATLTTHPESKSDRKRPADLEMMHAIPHASPTPPYMQSPTSLSGSMPLPQSPQAAYSPSDFPFTASNARFKQVVQKVILMQTAAGPGKPQWPKTALSTSPGRNDSTFFKPLTTGRLTHVNELKLALQKVEPVQRGMIHQALVRNLAFSPNGRFLATCSWDSTSAIVDVENMTVHRVLGHPNGFVGQVVWSPNGHHLLTKLTSGINVWTEEGVCIQRINRRTAVQCIAWFPSGKEFLSVEGNAFVHMDLKGNVIGVHVIDRVQVHDVAISNDGQRFFAVATLEQTNDGMKPVKARAEKRILVYDRLEKVLEIQVPILQDVRHISLTRDNNFAILSYDRKASLRFLASSSLLIHMQSPPQLWKIHIVADDARLNLHLTYMPKEDTDFTGPSYFGGRNDQFVICASKAGDIHIWHRETGILLRHIMTQDEESLTCIAWNDNAKTAMFATGSHEGSVLLWQAVEERIVPYFNQWVDFPSSHASVLEAPAGAPDGRRPTVEFVEPPRRTRM
ncbi:WD40 repeat-like protein [Exidia glandulosa HHB12029]|uniref:WD40 repeat-like protein n=1 Tax=Exidia glandulosa HHB12029 TaxID=1314781 RepID=A0A165LP89_EXIGL|nr:WD40 repeat-like protein [Exidia glandulosa HHB12029]